MRIHLLLFSCLVMLLSLGTVQTGRGAEIKVSIALEHDETIVFGIINEWEKPKDKDIVLDDRDLKVLRNVLDKGYRVKPPKGAHTDYAELHRILVTYWVYRKDSGVLDSHSIAITGTFGFLWHSFPSPDGDRLRTLLASKGVVFSKPSK